MKAEFEEKDFEAPLYNELKFGSHRIATPGQVFEGKFGIDAALEAEHPLFWDLFGYYDVPRGVVLDELRWGFMWHRLGRKRRLPTFTTNLLVQAKRPDVLSRVPSDLKRYGFTPKYWRFDITPHQQEILEKVAKKLRRRALVVYASPAFHTLDKLYDFTEAQTVVENTSFVKVERLQNHKKWNYFKSGSSGVAHSEPEEIEDLPFYEMINKAVEHNDNDENFSENLRLLHQCALDVCNETHEHNPVSKYYLRLHNRLMRMDEIFEIEETIHYVAFNLFCNVTKLKWLVV
ncbi:hypothetical protein L4D04_20435 [Photobacterium angustum]|uniref:hypothetical protein n=1 Tax=Photobacterium angustum TaxID=661 RepID=UPI003D0E5963